MASGTIHLNESSASGNYIDGKITWSSTTDKDANTSDVTVKLYVAKGHWDMQLTIPTTGTWTYTLKINGTTYTGSKSDFSVLEDWELVYTKTVTGIKHDDDGGKSITISASVLGPSGTTLAGHKTEGSGTATFDTVPRASTIESLSCSTSYLDGTITAKYTPKSALYYNQRIVYLNHGGTITSIRSANLGQKSAEQQTSTINLTDEELSAIYAKVTNTTSAKLRVSFITYSDSGYTSKIGSAQYKEITLTIPTKIKPTASLAVAAVNTNSWIKSRGLYVAGYSQVKLTLTAKAGEGASISSRTISGDGFSVSGSTVTANIDSAGGYTFNGKITDSRGRSASAPNAIEALPYFPPAVTSLKVERGTYSSGWIASENGPDIRVLFKVRLELVDNGNTYSATFKLDGTATAPDYGTTSDLASEASRAAYFYDIDGEISHAMTLTVADKVGVSASATITIPSKNVTIEFNDSGKGIAFGKTSEKDAFECAMDAEFSGKVNFVGNGAAIEAIRASLGICKEIWSGECSEGETVEIPELTNYQMFRVYMTGLSTIILAHRYNGYLRGIGGLRFNDGHRTYAINARTLDSNGEPSPSGTRLQITNLSYIDHAPDGSHGKETACSLSRLVGIV